MRSFPKNLGKRRPRPHGPIKAGMDQFDLEAAAEGEAISKANRTRIKRRALGAREAVQVWNPTRLASR